MAQEIDIGVALIFDLVRRHQSVLKLAQRVSQIYEYSVNTAVAWLGNQPISTNK